MPPWNNWYHCTLHTYGTWLRGDPRGWRSRNHREHVEGDYKNRPAKGTYDKQFQRSKDLMKRDPVTIDDDPVVRFVLKRLFERLQEFSIPVAIGAFDGVHAHILAQCPKRNPKIVIGIAKQYATAQLKSQGKALGFPELDLKPGEGIWATGSHPKPIGDEFHFDRAFDYIHDHHKRGASVIIPTNPT